MQWDAEQASIGLAGPAQYRTSEQGNVSALDIVVLLCKPTCMKYSFAASQGEALERLQPLSGPGIA